MVDAPERIWAYHNGNSQTYLTSPNKFHNVEYVRADLYGQAVKRAEDNNDRMIDAMSECDTLRTELEQVKQTLAVRDHESDFLKRRGDKAVKRAEAAERLAGARVVTDAAVKSITDFVCNDILPAYGIESVVGRNDAELSSAVRTALSALAEPAGEAEPVAWATVRVEDTPDGLLIHPDDAKEWGLQDDYPYKGTFLPDGRYRIALTTPPDASAIRGALRNLIDIIEAQGRDRTHAPKRETRDEANSRDERDQVFARAISEAEVALAGVKP